jgi:hypothetical protein
MLAVPAVADPALGCRDGDPLENVRDPERLRVIRRCVTATGEVRFCPAREGWRHPHQPRPGPKGRYQLNDENRAKHGGTLVVDIMPADQPGCRTGERVRYGRCTGAHVRTLRSGERIRVTGPWVLDRGHGWNEIHPAWRIDRQRRA